MPNPNPEPAGESLFTGAFAVAWNAFVAVWTVGALAGGGVLMALFSLPFWAAGFAVSRCARVYPPKRYSCKAVVLMRALPSAGAVTFGRPGAVLTAGLGRGLRH